MHSLGFLALLAIVALAASQAQQCRMDNKNMPPDWQNEITTQLTNRRQLLGVGAISWDENYARRASGLYNERYPCLAWYYDRKTTDCSNNEVGVIRNYVKYMDLNSRGGATELVEEWWATKEWADNAVDRDAQGYYYNTFKDAGVTRIGCSLAPTSCGQITWPFFYCITNRYVPYTSRKSP